MTAKLLLNADLGEGMPGDRAVIPHVDLVNVAAGGHAGGGDMLYETIELALKHNKQIGAHPSYPDRDNFGRISLWRTMPSRVLEDSLIEQMLTVVTAAQRMNSNVSYIKPHGALYNDAAFDTDVALFIAEAVRKVSNEVLIPGMPSLPLMMLANSAGITAVKDAGFSVIEEGFADRRYTSEGLLVPRSEENAIIHDIDQVQEQVETMWFSKQIVSVSGEYVSVQVDSVCVHGDTPEAVAMASALRAMLDSWETSI